MFERTNESIHEYCSLQQVGAPKSVGFSVDEFDSFSSLPLISTNNCHDPRGLRSLGFYAAYSGNSVPTFPGNLSVPPSKAKMSKKNDFMILTDGTDRLSRNGVTELSLHAA